MKRELVKISEEVNTTLPLNYNVAKEFFKDGEYYSTHAIYSYELRSFFIDKKGAIYNPRQLFAESIVDPIFVKNFAASITYLLILKTILKRRLLLQRAVVVFDEWSSNYYHTHIELLPRLLLSARKGILILQDSSFSRQTMPLILKTFDLQMPIHYINSLTYVRSAQYISKAGISGEINVSLIRELKKRVKIVVDQASPRLIYIKRKFTTYRKVLNEEIVEAVLHELGFETVFFEDHSYERQIQLAAGANVMVGMHGAGFTNTLFMKSGSHIIEFRRDGVHHNHCYWQLASAVGVNYSILIGQPDNDLELEGDGCNLTIDVNMLRSTVEKLMSGKILVSTIDKPGADSI